MRKQAKSADELIEHIKDILETHNFHPVGDEQFWNAHDTIAQGSPLDALKLEDYANQLMALDGQTTMSAWGKFDERTIAKVASKLLEKGEVKLAREVLALTKPRE